MYIYHSNKEVNGEFGRKMDQDVNGNRKILEGLNEVNG